MKLAVTLLAALFGLYASPAFAQVDLGRYDAGQLSRPDTQVLAFFRIPMGEKTERKPPVIGFGLFSDCQRIAARHSAATGSACEAEPIRSLEFSRDLYSRDWLLAFTGEKHWVGIARWYPDSGFARVREYGPILSGPGGVALED